MGNKTRIGQARKRVLIRAVLLGLMAPAAFAGPHEDTAQAEKEFARGNLVLSLSLWKKAADQGYAPAQARLGDMLDKSEDNEQAAEWYRKAAAQGDAAGEFGLGQMYAKGEGVKQDIAQARAYIMRAAEKNHFPAVLLMRELTKNGGLGVTADFAQSAAWDARVKEIVAREKAQSTAEKK